MERKLWSEDELHDLIGEAISVIKESLKAKDARIRLDAAIQLIQLPVSMAINAQQKAKEQFPTTLDIEK